MKTINIKVENKSKNNLPEYAHPTGDSGMDVRADIEEPITLMPLERHLFPTGLYIELPEGYEIQVRPRSGLALKRGLTVLNTPGTIDENYRGNLGVILINLSSDPQTIEPGERIAQLVLSSVDKINWIPVEEINKDNTDRGENGYSSSGRF